MSNWFIEQVSNYAQELASKTREEAFNMHVEHVEGFNHVKESWIHGFHAGFVSGFTIASSRAEEALNQSGKTSINTEPGVN